MTKTENSKRIVTATLLAGVTIAATLLLEPLLFSIAIGLITSAAAWEWCHLGRATLALHWKIAFILSIGAGVPVLLFFPPVLPWVVAVSLLWWISTAALIALGGRRPQPLRWHARKWQVLLVVFPAAVAITGLHAIGSEGRWYVLACFLIVWTTDTCAFIVGRVYGKTLLVPGISPAKTVEGAGGGLFGALMIGSILYETLPTEMIFSRLDWLVLTIVTAGFAVIGDLTESTFKRAAGVKDSGRILPGHGGILDRIDSAFASSPVFVAGILFAAR